MGRCATAVFDWNDGVYLVCADFQFRLRDSAGGDSGRCYCNDAACDGDIGRIAVSGEADLRQIVSIGIAFAGAAIVCLWENRFTSVAGCGWILLQVGCFTAYNLLAQSAVAKYNLFVVTEYGLLFAALTFLLLLPRAVRQTEVFPIAGVALILLGLYLFG